MEMILFVLMSLNIVLHSNAQVPGVCTDVDSLANKTCCPSTQHGVCGEDAGRGQCVKVSNICFTGYEEDNIAEIRLNWPIHYYTNVCSCTGNYGGYDCSECDFGYSGSDCQEKLNKKRKSIIQQTAAEWELYNKQLQLAKTTNSSRYVILIPSNLTSDYDLSTAIVRNISVYDHFIWLHVYATATHIDNYNHSSSGKLTVMQNHIARSWCGSSSYQSSH